MKLTLGQAAKTAKRSKGTLSKALNSGGISAEKDDKGRWQIDPSELSRWMSANPFPNGHQNQIETTVEVHENSALGVEVKMLREQMDEIRSMSERERQTLIDQIEDLKIEAERRSREHMQALAVLTDQREPTPGPPKRGLWARLTGQEG